MILKAWFAWLLSVMILWTQAFSTEVKKEIRKLQDPPVASPETPPTTLGIYYIYMLKIGQEFSRNIYLGPTSKVSREFWSYKFVKSLNEYGS